MKYNITKKIYLEMTLDSSELVMFNKGGKFKIEIDSNDLIDQIGYDEDGKVLEDIPLEISVQLDRAEQRRFNFVTDNKHANKPDVDCDAIIPPEMMLKRENDQINTPHCCKENIKVPSVRLL